MNFVENNGKKVAAILCVASAFPVVATVVAAKEEPGWHGDRYVNEDKTVAKGWQEIEGKSYYFSENGTVDSSKTESATTASVSSSITGDVKETVATASQEAVQEENDAKAEAEAQAQAETAATDTSATEAATTIENENPADDSIVETPFGDESAMVPDQVVTPSQDTTTTNQPETPAQDTTQDAVEPEAPAQDNNTYTDNSNAEDTTQTPEAPAQDDTTTEPEAPAQDNTTTEDTTVVETPTQDTTATQPTTSNLGQRISAAAQNLVGVTDGQWCTQVVQQALANAGVSDAYQLWPDQYVGQYGYYTSDPQEGDLIYYNNGGRGIDHIAIYIGNGQAVHGNYLGKTVIASAYVPGAASPQFIRVVR